jgi:hypothetical protein
MGLGGVKAGMGMLIKSMSKVCMMIRSMSRVCMATGVHMSGPRKQMQMDKIRFS